MTYARDTSVSVEKSRAEIETTVRRYGATAFSSGWNVDGMARVEFMASDRRVRFTLTLPAQTDRRFRMSPGGRKRLNEAESNRAWEQACRSKWRSLLLAIKAKLEAVASGISVFEDEFLAFVVDPMTDKTVGEQLRPAIAARYEGRPALLGLPAPPEEKTT